MDYALWRADAIAKSLIEELDICILHSPSKPKTLLFQMYGDDEVEVTTPYLDERRFEYTLTRYSSTMAAIDVKVPQNPLQDLMRYFRRNSQSQPETLAS